MKYIFKNAFKSITRNKGRNILMGIIIMVIACACAVTLSIRNAANKLVEAYENKYNVEASLTYNREKLMENIAADADSAEEKIEAFNDIEAITIDEINTYGDSDYVDYYYYTYNVGMNSDDIDAATEQIAKVTTSTKTTTNQGGFPGGFGGGSQSTTTRKTEIIQNMGTSGDFTLVGYSSYEGMTDFVDGSYTITDGEVSDDFTSNDCVINSELAELNDLAVGDTITIQSVNDDDLTYDLVITGIFTDSSEATNDMTSMYSSSVNKIITNSTFVEKVVADDDDAKTTITPTFVLTSKDVVDKFTTEVTTEGLDENYEVTTNLDTIESETESITNVSSFATTFLIVTLAIGGVVLLILNMINVRERKYEIGVLRTIGMKKSTVTLQFVFELLSISVIALLLGAAIGAVSSVKIANKMLASEITSASEEQEKIRENFGGLGKTSESTTDEDTTTETDTTDNKVDVANGVVKISEVTSIDAVVDFKVLMELMAIGLGLTLFSSLSAMISIAKFSPLAILKERS